MRRPKKEVLPEENAGPLRSGKRVGLRAALERNCSRCQFFAGQKHRDGAREAPERIRPLFFCVEPVGGEDRWSASSFWRSWFPAISAGMPCGSLAAGRPKARRRQREGRRDGPGLNSWSTLHRKSQVQRAWLPRRGKRLLQMRVHPRFLRDSF